MKTNFKVIIILILSLNSSLIFSQDYMSFEINNITKEIAWSSITKTFKDLKLPRTYLYKNTSSTESDYYNYTSLMIKNRLKFKINYENNKLTISLFKRQYLTNRGWADNSLPMSKKKAGKILNPIKDKIIELTKNKNITSVSQKKTNNKEPVNVKKFGIYEDFIIVKTGDPEMDLLAIHKNGNIMAFKLWEDEITVKALIFKENNNTDALIMDFNEKGVPIGMEVNNLSFKISLITEDNLLLQLKDQDGNFIGEEKIVLNSPLTKKSIIDFNDNSKNHGPNYFFEFKKFPIYISDDLSDGLGNASFGFSVVADALDKIPKDSPISKAFVKAYPKKLGSNLLIAYSIHKMDPENKFFLNELSTCAQVLITIAPFVKTAVVGTTAATSLSTLAAVGIILGGAKISYDAAMRLKERHWPTPIFNIYKPNEPLRTGSFGEERNSPGYITIEYNYPDKEIKIISEHPEELNLELYHIDHLNGYDKAYYNVFAKESEHKTHRITAYHIIYDGYLESKVLDPETISKEIEISIEEPNYFYLTDCSKCSSDSSIKKECEEKLNECKQNIANQNNIYFILDENNKIIDSNEQLNDERLSYIKSSNQENKGFKPFVKESDCSFDCKNDNNSPKNSLENTNTISYSHLQAPIFIDEISSEDHFLDDRRDYNNTIENIKEDLSPTHNYIPIHLDKNGSFNGTFKENIYDLITEITISGNIDLKSKLGSISVTFKQTKNVKASPMNACDYDLEFSYTFNYKDLKLSFYNNTLPYTLKPNENSILTVSNYKFKEDTKCPKRNFSKEKIYKKINEEYLKESLANKSWSYFRIHIN